MGTKYFRKNYFDLDRESPTITITDGVATNNGQAVANLLRNRSNLNGWVTTGSTDAANTEILVDLVSTQQFDRILLIKMNFKAYTIKYWDGAAYQDFSTPVAETVNATATKIHSFDLVTSSRIKIIITGTFVVNDDKFMAQLIITQFFGEFNFQPRLRPEVDKSRRSTKYLSGKSHIAKSASSYNARLTFNNVVDDDDMTLVELLFNSYEGFLIWPSGGTTTQFSMQREGWRLIDIYLVNLRNEYNPEWEDGHYAHGMPVDLSLVEVV